jgi:hypothetical protein
MWCVFSVVGTEFERLLLLNKLPGFLGVSTRVIQKVSSDGLLKKKKSKIYFQTIYIAI